MFELAQTEGVGSLARTGEVTGIHEFLEFILAGQSYAFELAQIGEIQNVSTITRVPRAPRDVLGIFSVRGRLLTLIDLKTRLRLPTDAAARPSARVLLSRTVAGEEIGFLVDEVRQVVRLGASDIELSRSVFGGELSEHVVGVGRPGDNAMILLDMRSVAQ